MNYQDKTVTLYEPGRSLEIVGTFDVVVCGGGIAGVAAAVAAARAGASVCLLEKESALGGLATLGNVTTWLPICDGMGRQVIGGIGEELLRLSVRDLRREDSDARFTGIPAGWTPGGTPEERQKQRFRVNFNPGAYILVLEEWLTAAGVTLFYDTRVCAVRRETRCITHLVIESKSGRQALGCRTVVDTTGDADVCALAGEETESLDSNVAAGWYYCLRDGRLHLRPLSRRYDRNFDAAALTDRGFRGDEVGEVTAQILASRKMIREDLAALRKKQPEADIQPFAPPTIACFRATRRLVGRLSLRESHKHRWFEDAVALTGDWRRKGPVFAIALRMLQGVANRNLLTAGRCLSADRSIWDCTRAIPTCAVTGEAAGLAAAMASAETGGAVDELSVSALQESLRAKGGLLDEQRVRAVT